MVKAQDASIEEIIKDITNAEDMDTALVVHYNRHGKFVVMEIGGSLEIWADTLKDALIKFFTEYMEIAIHHTASLEDIQEFQNLDWRDVYNARYNDNT